MPENYIDILKRQNPMILIEEKDFSIYNITQFYNKVNLVIGTSKTGPINLPVLLISPENMEQIFGKRDRFLERKGSYFHKTIETMLEEGPVIAINIRPTNNDLDFYHWQNISTASDIHNSKKRSNPLCDFYDTSTGFWKRSKDQLMDVAKNNVSDSDKKPLTIVNQGQKPVSVLMFKSLASGFDMPAEEWYNGNIPDFIHPKEFISEYLIDMIAVEGDWNNYEELSVNPKWREFFDRSGIRRDKLQNFLDHPEVVLIKQWTGSLIPFFRDSNNRNIYIENVVNEDVNETGILVSYDACVVEKDFRSGNIDMLGDKLTDNKIPKFDFLSYKRYMTDFVCFYEKTIDNVGNSFGNNDIGINGRTHFYGEGYINNAKLKPIIISTTTSLFVKPIDASNDAYVIINGNIIELNSDIEDVIALHDIVSMGNKVAYVIVATSNGIEFRTGKEVPVENSLFLPEIDWSNELVLGYHIITQDKDCNFNTELVPVLLDENGYINPFRTGVENLNNDNNPKISTGSTDYVWQNKIVFESIQKFNNRDYNQGTIYHMWSWLSNNLSEDRSIVLDINGHKQRLQYIEQGNDDNDKWVKVSAYDRNSNIVLSSGTNGSNGEICLYITDNEFLVQDETKWREQQQTYKETEGLFGIIGANSEILDSYYDGEINSGDPFFWSISEEYDVSFLYDNKTRQNLIVFNDGLLFNDYQNRKIIMKGSEFNDGIFTFLNFVDYNGNTAISVQEKIVPEYVDKIDIFDAENPKIINLYFVNNKLQARVDMWDGDPEELYERLFEKEPETQWAKSLEIEQIMESNKILVDADRYFGVAQEGYFLLAQDKKLTDDDNEVVRNWTRIIDVVRLEENPDLLLIETDSPIKIIDNSGDLQTQMLQPIYEWVDTLDFKVLKPFIPRLETFPNGTEERLQEILNIIAPNTKLSEALTTNQLDWRYLIDSYGLGLVENSKHQLANIVQRKQTAMGFLNAPSVKDFKKFTGTSYVTDGKFDTQKLLNGGERRNNNSIRYSMSNIGDSHVTYGFPYVAVPDGNRFYLEPPATHIAKRYMSKFNDRVQREPWTIMAGINDGRIRTISGLEEIFSTDELVDLNTFGFNVIASGFRNTIFYIHNENTAVPSSLSSSLRFIHVREVLIELETEMGIALENSQWTEYTDSNVNSILDNANSICEDIRQRDGIFSFRNEAIVTNELRDAQLMILNTYIEPVQGMGTIILRVSVSKTGQVQSLSEQFSAR